MYIRILYALLITTSLAKPVLCLNEGSITHDTIPVPYSLTISFTHGNVSSSSVNLFHSLPNTEDIAMYRGINLELLFHSKIKKDWECIYGFPKYGIGISVLDFFSPKIIGYPISVYGFMQPQLYKLGSLTFNANVALGLSFNWKHYGPLNLDNNAISLARAVYINLGASIQYKLNDNWSIGFGGNVHHFSNGGTRRPNKGINTRGFTYSLSYAFNSATKYSSAFNSVVNTPYKKNELTLALHAGSQNMALDTNNLLVVNHFSGINFLVWGITTTYHRQISRKSKIGLGVNLLDDGSIGATFNELNNKVETHQLPFIGRLKFSIFPSYELVIGRLGVLLQPGLYVTRLKYASDVSRFYQRIGIRYNVTDHLFCGINLRAFNFKSANFIEYSVGYRMIQ